MLSVAYAFALATQGSLPPQMKLLSSEIIYNEAPFPACHAATIEEAKSGKLIAAWFGGTAESQPDVKIYSAELQASRWTAPRLIAEGRSPNNEPRACYNPVLFQPSTGPLLLFYKVGTGPQTWWGMMSRSDDDGQSWDTPVRLPEGIFGPIKNRPMELADGTLICPSSSENEGWRVHFEFTKDLGLTWSRTEPLNDGKVVGAIQPSLLNLRNGMLRAVGRTQQGKVFAVDSIDNGKTWGKMSLTDVPNPNSGCDALTLKDGRHVLVYNHSITSRTPLCVAVSINGNRWERVLSLESEPGEFSYPSLIQSRDGLIHIVYTWQRKRIKHVVVDPSAS